MNVRRLLPGDLVVFKPTTCFIIDYRTKKVPTIRPSGSLYTVIATGIRCCPNDTWVFGAGEIIEVHAASLKKVN